MFSYYIFSSSKTTTTRLDEVCSSQVNLRASESLTGNQTISNLPKQQQQQHLPALTYILASRRVDSEYQNWNDDDTEKFEINLNEEDCEMWVAARCCSEREGGNCVCCDQSQRRFLRLATSFISTRKKRATTCPSEEESSPCSLFVYSVFLYFYKST